MLISVNQSDGTPMYFQLVRQIKHLIATGRMGPGDELPSVRTLAQQLLVNPNTVVRAYRELESAGLIYTRRGAGCYVSERPVPYSDAECRRILSERIDALVAESRNLGFDLERVIELLRERDTALRAVPKKEESEEASHDRK